MASTRGCEQASHETRRQRAFPSFLSGLRVGRGCVLLCCKVVPVAVPEVGVDAKVRGSYPTGFLATRGQRAPHYPQPLAPQFYTWSAVSACSAKLRTSWGRAIARFVGTEAGRCVGLFCAFSVGASEMVLGFVEHLGV
jgi:hypothetical protein